MTDQQTIEVRSGGSQCTKDIARFDVIEDWRVGRVMFKKNWNQNEYSGNQSEWVRKGCRSHKIGICVEFDIFYPKCLSRIISTRCCCPFYLQILIKFSWCDTFLALSEEHMSLMSTFWRFMKPLRSSYCSNTNPQTKRFLARVLHFNYGALVSWQLFIHWIYIKM